MITYNYILLIVLFNLLFFWRTLSYGWVSDDIPTNVKPLRQPKNKWDKLWLQFRGLGYFKSREAHWITLILHIINSTLIFLAFGKNTISLMASLMFSINPINTQGGSIWISGKPYSTATLCMLLAFTFPFLSPLFYITTSFFSGNAIFAGFPFFLTKYWFLGLLPILCFGIFYKVIMKKWRLIATTNIEMRKVALRKMVTFLKTFGYYFSLCVMPYKLGLYHNFIWGIGVNKEYNKRVYKLNKDFYYGFFIFFFTIVGIVFNYNNLIGFGLFWFFINILMWCNIVTVQQQIAERYLYLPCVGIMLALSTICFTLPYHYCSIMVCAILTYYATRLWYYREAYTNDYWMVEYNLIEQKNSHYAWVSRGIKKFYVCDFDGALRDFGEARIHTSHDFKQNMNMASMFLVLGDVSHAEEFLKYADETVYDGVEKQQREEFVIHTRKLIEKMKTEGRIKIEEIRIIK